MIGAPHGLRTQFNQVLDIVQDFNELELAIERQNRRANTHRTFLCWSGRAMWK